MEGSKESRNQEENVWLKQEGSEKPQYQSSSNHSEAPKQGFQTLSLPGYFLYTVIEWSGSMLKSLFSL